MQGGVELGALKHFAGEGADPAHKQDAGREDDERRQQAGGEVEKFVPQVVPPGVGGHAGEGVHHLLNLGGGGGGVDGFHEGSFQSAFPAWEADFLMYEEGDTPVIFLNTREK